ncbi:MAG: chaperone modulator CbpM [Verrucomicrobiota bacterium]
MSSEPPSGDPPVFEDEADLTYSIDVIAGLAGVDPPTVLHYQEQGWLRPARVAPEGDAPAGFDAESLRQLRRIEYLRSTCGVNETGLQLILSLLLEVEQLREECRQLRR